MVVAVEMTAAVVEGHDASDSSTWPTMTLVMKQTERRKKAQ
jgi:hypothetical protein